MDDQGFLVEANEWFIPLVRLSIQMQDILHRGNKLGIHGWNAPVFVLPGFQCIFLIIVVMTK